MTVGSRTAGAPGAGAVHIVTRKPPRILVVSPCWWESRAEIERCIASVAAQTLRADHLIVTDGDPPRFAWLGKEPVRHLPLDTNHANSGNTPRAVGAALGIAEGYDAIALLDADNWFEPAHLELCHALAASRPCDYVTTSRHLVDEAGNRLPLAEDPPETHVDTNVLYLLPASYPVLGVWGQIPPQIAIGGDRFFYAALRARRLRRLHTLTKTVNYVLRLPGAYASIGRPMPGNVRSAPDWPGIARWIETLDEGERESIRRSTGVWLDSLSVLLPEPHVAADNCGKASRVEGRFQCASPDR